MKWICILILFLSPFFIWGQKENVLFVSTQRLTTLNLSNIADKSTVISLNKKPGQHQSIWFSGQYIYLAGITNNVHQYHLSGQYIRTFKCGGYILGITGDEAKHELYIRYQKMRNVYWSAMIILVNYCVNTHWNKMFVLVLFLKIKFGCSNILCGMIRAITNCQISIV